MKINKVGMLISVILVIASICYFSYQNEMTKPQPGEVWSN
jgi:hypothetical protein